jgi:hypothetical protein
LEDEDTNRTWYHGIVLTLGVKFTGLAAKNKTLDATSAAAFPRDSSMMGWFISSKQESRNV